MDLGAVAVQADPPKDLVYRVLELLVEWQQALHFVLLEDVHGHTAEQVEEFDEFESFVSVMVPTFVGNGHFAARVEDLCLH